MPKGSKHKANQGVYEQFFDAIQANGFADDKTPAERAHQSPKQLAELMGLRLHAAASRGDAEACSRVLAEGASAGYANFEGATALMMAAREGHLKCVKVVLPHSDPQQKCLRGWSAMGWAALEGHIPCLKALLPTSNPSSLNYLGRTALAVAIQAGKVNVVELLLPVTDLAIKDGLFGDVAKMARQHASNGVKFKAISTMVQRAVKEFNKKPSSPAPLGKPKPAAP